MWSERDGIRYGFEDTAYIGDDLVDIPCMRGGKEGGGVTGCPNDAANEVKQVAEYVSMKNGGDGAVREFIEYVISVEAVVT